MWPPWIPKIEQLESPTLVPHVKEGGSNGLGQEGSGIVIVHSLRFNNKSQSSCSSMQHKVGAANLQLFRKRVSLYYIIKIISWLKTNFNQSPSHSAHKPSNHRFSKIDKINPDTNLYKTEHTYTNNKHTFSKN